MNLLRIAIVALAGLGCVAAVAMFAKARTAAAGGLDEPSIVELPDARLFFRIPNSAFGIGFYTLVVLAAALNSGLAYALAAALSLLALATSIYLGLRLVRQRLSCGRCWTAHGVNVLLCPLLLAAALVR